MKTRLLSLLLTLLMVLAITTPALADTKVKVPEVRVNGRLVEFPDAQPYYDENNRTMIPVRFVTEALGADVSWSTLSKGALIEKDGISIALPVGTNQMIVTRDGVKTTKTLDTKTVLKEDRTYVPIRAVAEELGAWVNYSATYNTVEIYKDVLTPSEIEQLHALSLDPWWGEHTIDKYKSILSSKTMYEDMSEAALRDTQPKIDYELKGVYTDAYYNTKTDTMEDRIAFLAEEIPCSMAKKYTWEDFGITASFRTDASCIYRTLTQDRLYVNTGYLTITVADDADIASYAKFNKTQDLDFSKLLEHGKTHTFIIESNWRVGVGSYARTAVYDRTDGGLTRWS